MSPVLAALAEALGGRPSLRLVVLASVALSGTALLLSAAMLLLRLWLAARGAWRARRARFFQGGVEKALLEAPDAEVLEAFRPRLPGDAGIVQDEIKEAMRHLRGAPFDALLQAARSLGFVEANLRDLRRPGKSARARAMEALGVMRAQEAVGPLLDSVERESMELRLVALRSLALIGDPSALPAFVKASDRFSPAMLVRLVSLMLEFGAPARPRVAEVIARRPEAFPPRVMRLLLSEAAAAEADRAA